MQTINKKGLTVKDLVTVGIFSALFLVFALVGGIFFAPNPVLTFYMPVGSALLCGPVYLLMLAKVQKRWAASILGARTKLLLILLCVLSAMAAPSLYFQFTLVALIGLLSALSGRWRYALRGIIAYALICAFTVWCMGVLRGTWRTMFVAFLGLVHKVYACGMLAGLVISTTKVGEFLSAMARLRISKKLTIPIAVMLRYLPTIRGDWHFIKDAMRLRDVSPTLWGFLKAPAMTVNCIYVPLLTAASKAADELSIASVTRGIENPKPRTCLVEIQMRAADCLSAALFLAFLVTELICKGAAV